ncbi:MAG: hypothetical protein H0Z24_07215 [Thermosipho sp. (in: Bacteria)]|nr:hypothetical protein [Thermosipho sp. (in: thermotogales)]
MKKVCLVNIDTGMLKRFLGIPVEYVNADEFDKISCKETGNLFFIYADDVEKLKYDCDVKIIKEDEKIVVYNDDEYLISLNEGDYHVLDYRTDGEIHRYILKTGNSEGLYIFKEKLSNEEILHFLLSLFVIEKIV